MRTDTYFPLVGIGASAGGLAAFEAFFSGMPADADEFGRLIAGPGIAFVLVQHLAPDHKSILSTLIQRYTRMPVFEVEDGMVVQPNCVYIIPPNHDMAFLGGALQLLEPLAPRGQRLPIDFFFRSLAQDQGARAIGIVLSGTGSDGTLGIRAIKAEGGMVMAQTPETTEFTGMPRSAIATGLVDYELAPPDMATQLIAYVHHSLGKLTPSPLFSTPKNENSMNKIFILVRAQTGHDFSQYKQNTIHRRIERRMALHQIKTLDNYVKYLQQTPAEVDALFIDFLIGVTHFFRDPEAFKALEDLLIPKLLSEKKPGGAIRVWSIGCSTGEEAYSLAILLAEHIETLKKRYAVQIFATDIDAQAIARARTGIFPASIAADITPERLARFFTVEPNGDAYRINKYIRDMLVFSEQDVIKDPPFSKIDLISCRNLLIYLKAALQKQLIPLFHYSMNPGGILFLGTSEGVGEFHDLFTPLGRKNKLYQRNENYQGIQPRILNLILPPLMPKNTFPMNVGKRAFQQRLPLRELTERALLEQVVPAGVMVNAHGDILYLHGRTGLYLEPTPGDIGINNIIKMAREGLRLALTKALHKAVLTNEQVHCPGVLVRTNGHFIRINLNIHPINPGSTPNLKTTLYLVVFEEVPDSNDALFTAPSMSNTDNATQDAETPVTVLSRELRAKDEYLRATHEELETANEELKSSNEEMHSLNEELQSTNEELETSKEELQSVNEELVTVNTELQSKILDLSHANNDMNNLLAGTRIATLFVDHQLSAGFQPRNDASKTG